jgi:anti-sigma regulatory factor (Ser/Thr protein kinase)
VVAALRAGPASYGVGCTAVEEIYGPALGQDVRSAHDREPAQVLPLLLDLVFGREDITAVRHQVSDCLAAIGFSGDRLSGFVLAVNEVITNVVLHAGGHGRLVLATRDGSAWCTVTDSGPGIPQRYLTPPDVPEAFEVGGRGIGLAYQMCDEVAIATGPIGTTIGLRMALPG